MNLYEIMSLVAVSAGLGGAIGDLRGTHPPTMLIAAAVVVGVIAGAMAFLTLRKAITQLKSPTERTLAVLYVLTFFCILLATWIASFGTLAVAESLHR